MGQNETREVMVRWLGNLDPAFHGFQQEQSNEFAH
jgi:hypothetical protein